MRWLPRQRASGLLLPGNDLWCFDAETVVFTHLSGDGAIQGYELTPDPALVAQCVTAFEAAWRVAIPHGDYMPRPTDDHPSTAGTGSPRCPPA